MCVCVCVCKWHCGNGDAGTPTIFFSSIFILAVFFFLFFFLSRFASLLDHVRMYHLDGRLRQVISFFFSQLAFVFFLFFFFAFLFICIFLICFVMQNGKQTTHHIVSMIFGLNSFRYGKDAHVCVCARCMDCMVCDITIHTSYTQFFFLLLLVVRVLLLFCV